MPTENGRIYRLPNETPAKGISLDDIGSCLGMSARDLGTLCQGMSGYETDRNTGNVLYKDANVYEGKIAKWSKSKPVVFTGANSLLPPETNDNHSLWENRRAGNQDGYRTNPWAISANTLFKAIYGIEVPTGCELYEGASTSDFVTTGGALDTASDGWLLGLMRDGHKSGVTPITTLRWRYEPPVTASGTPFILLDFDKYNNNVICPLPTLPENMILTARQVADDEYPNSTVVNIRIDAVAPLYLPDGNITLDEVDAAMKTRMVFEGALTTNVSKGVKDMYLCALLYHYSEEGGTGTLNRFYWVSSVNTFGVSGGKTIVFNKINATNTGVNPNGESNEEIEFCTSVVNNNSGQWMVKFFFCTDKIQQNVKPGQVAHINGATGTAKSKGSYALLRGADNIAGTGVPVTFVSPRDISTTIEPYVRFIVANKTEGVSANDTYYGVQWMLVNYTPNGQSGVKKVVDWYNSTTKAHIGRPSGTFPVPMNQLTPYTSYEETQVANTGGVSTSIDMIVLYTNDNEGRNGGDYINTGMLIKNVGITNEVTYFSTDAGYDEILTENGYAAEPDSCYPF